LGVTMRRMTLITAAGLLLVGVGVAVAHGFDSRSVKEVSAAFTATTVSNLRTSTCTGADGSYTKSRATYTGAATSTEPSLNGPTTIDATSYVNTTTNVGYVSAAIRIDGSDGRIHAGFQGVLTGGSVVGLTAGGIHHDSDEASTKLLANVSAAFTAASGFASGKIGGDTTAGDAIFIKRGGCTTPKPPKPEKVKARGAVTAVSTSSIAVAGVTCAVPANSKLQEAVAKVKVTDYVSIECEVANGATTLTHVSGHRH
jgi:hypothetical protein